MPDADQKDTPVPGGLAEVWPFRFAKRIRNSQLANQQTCLFDAAAVRSQTIGHKVYQANCANKQQQIAFLAPN